MAEPAPSTTSRVPSILHLGGCQPADKAPQNGRASFFIGPDRFTVDPNARYTVTVDPDHPDNNVTVCGSRPSGPHSLEYSVISLSIPLQSVTSSVTIFSKKLTSATPGSGRGHRCDYAYSFVLARPPYAASLEVNRQGQVEEPVSVDPDQDFDFEEVVVDDEGNPPLPETPQTSVSLNWPRRP
jgi:hypothetical protein